MRTRYAVCPECAGTGGWIPVDKDDWFGADCDMCMGTGRIKVAHPDGDFIMHRKEVNDDPVREVEEAPRGRAAR